MVKCNFIFLNRKKYKFRISKKRSMRYCNLEHCPQRRAVCRKLLITSPKKPNSAKRKIAKVTLSTKKTIFVCVPGQNPHGLSPYSVVLVRGGRVRDIPGIRYKLIKGAKDFLGERNRITSRSKYGTKKKL